jgi:hypothetical protein
VNRSTFFLNSAFLNLPSLTSYYLTKSNRGQMAAVLQATRGNAVAAGRGGACSHRSTRSPPNARPMSVGVGRRADRLAPCGYLRPLMLPQSTCWLLSDCATAAVEVRMAPARQRQKKGEAQWVEPIVRASG